MAGIVPSKPIIKTLQSAETLNDALDNLWQQYLDLLDQYQTLRQSLTNNLSSGHLSLAQASFSNSNRIRYGQDYYDERMKASTFVSVDKDQPFQVVHLPPPKSFPTKEQEREISPDNEQSTKVAEPKINPKTSTEGANDEKDEAPKPACDPLSWFGLFAPPALKASQAAFRAATVEDVAGLAKVEREMRGLEREIRRGRKRVGRGG